jgi:hypothetical protein
MNSNIYFDVEYLNDMIDLWGKEQGLNRKLSRELIIDELSISMNVLRGWLSGHAIPKFDSMVTMMRLFKVKNIEDFVSNDKYFGRSRSENAKDFNKYMSVYKEAFK